jgi:hypothetical protein
LPIKHEIEIHKPIRSHFRAPGFKSLMVLIAMGIFAWGYLSLAPFALLSLTLILVVPLLSIASAYWFEAESGPRYSLWLIASLSFIVGLPFTWLNKEDFTSLGLEVESIRRVIPVSEEIADPKEAEAKFGHVSMDQLQKLGIENRRRAAVQLARFGRWLLAYEAWSSTVVVSRQKSEMRASSYIKVISEKGVSKASLLPLCQNIHASGFKAQSVSLWRAYYPKEVPKNWRQPFEEYAP